MIEIARGAEEAAAQLRAHPLYPYIVNVVGPELADDYMEAHGDVLMDSRMRWERVDPKCDSFPRGFPRQMPAHEPDERRAYLVHNGLEFPFFYRLGVGEALFSVTDDLYHVAQFLRTGHYPGVSYRNTPRGRRRNKDMVGDIGKVYSDPRMKRAAGRLGPDYFFEEYMRLLGAKDGISAWQGHVDMYTHPRVHTGDLISGQSQIRAIAADYDGFWAYPDLRNNRVGYFVVCLGDRTIMATNDKGRLFRWLGPPPPLTCTHLQALRADASADPCLG